MPNLQFLLLAAIIAALPGLFTYLRAKRARRLAAANLQMTQAVTRFQQILLDGKITSGSVCHDWLFGSLSHLQFAKTLPYVWGPWRKQNKSNTEKITRMIREMNDIPEIGHCVNSYIIAYEQRRRASSPIRYHLNKAWLNLFFVLKEAYVRRDRLPALAKAVIRIIREKRQIFVPIRCMPAVTIVALASLGAATKAADNKALSPAAARPVMQQSGQPA